MQPQSPEQPIPPIVESNPLQVAKRVTRAERERQSNLRQKVARIAAAAGMMGAGFFGAACGSASQDATFHPDVSIAQIDGKIAPPNQLIEHKEVADAFPLNAEIVRSDEHPGVGSNFRLPISWEKANGVIVQERVSQVQAPQWENGYMKEEVKSNTYFYFVPSKFELPDLPDGEQRSMETQLDMENASLDGPDGILPRETEILTAGQVFSNVPDAEKDKPVIVQGLYVPPDKKESLGQQLQANGMGIKLRYGGKPDEPINGHQKFNREQKRTLLITPNPNFPKL